MRNLKERLAKWGSRIGLSFILSAPALAIPYSAISAAQDRDESSSRGYIEKNILPYSVMLETGALATGIGTTIAIGEISYRRRLRQ
jgi:hypothetical protein